MPFLGPEVKAPEGDHILAKALKSSLKKSKKMAQHTGGAVEQTNEEQNSEEVTAEAREKISQPPLSTSSSSSSSKLTIAQCPARLSSLIPPPNYGTVERGKIFRSSFPQAHHLEFIAKLNIRSILSLVDTEPCEEFHHFMNVHGIKRNHLSIAANKDGGQMDVKDICDAVIFAKDPKNQPVHIHCNQGKHRTGCVVACLRKYQGRPMDEVLGEYKTYAYPKERPGDIAFIKAFDPQMVDAYAKCYAHTGVSPKDFRVDSKLDIWELSASFPDELSKTSFSDSSMSSSYESGSDLMMQSVFPQDVRTLLASWSPTRVRDFANMPRSDRHLCAVRHENETTFHPEDLDSPVQADCVELCDDCAERQHLETVAFSATATTPPIAVSARSSFSS